MSSWLPDEIELRKAGHQHLCGLDEAGRGPLAGPVVAGAVILPAEFEPNGIADSKTLSATKRESAYRVIVEQAISWAVGIADIDEIDEINILQASLLAMRRAYEKLETPPDFLLVDGNRELPESPLPQRTVIGGDGRLICVAAASIIAKVERDRIMCAYHQRFPQYGFDTHKGYPTRKHRQAIARYGPCEIHRRSFQLLPAGQNLELHL